MEDKVVPLSEEVREKMIADVMGRSRDEAIAKVEKALSEVGVLEMLLALPALFVNLVKSTSGERSVQPDFLSQMEAESWMIHGDNRYAYMTIPHALYRQIDDLMSVATTAGYNSAKEELFGQGD